MQAVAVALWRLEAFCEAGFNPKPTSHHRPAVALRTHA